jgi:hypothetical protein
MEQDGSNQPLSRYNGTIPTFHGQNEAAERLRRLVIYQQARTIMVPPHQAHLPGRQIKGIRPLTELRKKNEGKD